MEYTAHEPVQFERPHSALSDFTQRDINTSSVHNHVSAQHLKEHAALPPPRTFETEPRSSSTSSQLSQELQIPALSALANLAASAPAAPTDGSTRSSTPSSTMVQPTQYAPAATAGGQQIGAPQNSQPPSCLNCATSTTPLWRRDESGSVLCNACGLFLKLHGRPRPISLKTDVIKSRNRVKTGAPRKRDSADGHFQSQSQGYLQPQLTVDGAALIPPHPHTYDPQLSSGENIAPPHIFDSLTSDHFGLRQPSPSGSSVNGNNPHLEPPPSYDALQTQNVQLRTRVNELEVIQQLFQGRVEELERGEREAKEAERIKTEEAERVKSDLDTLIARSAELQRRLDELDASGSPARKRARMATVEEPPEEPDVDVS